MGESALLLAISRCPAHTCVMHLPRPSLLKGLPIVQDPQRRLQSDPELVAVHPHGLEMLREQRLIQTRDSDGANVRLPLRRHETDLIVDVEVCHHPVLEVGL